MIPFSVRTLSVGLLLWAASNQVYANCSQWPAGMTFVGLTEHGWQTYGVLDPAKGPQVFDLNAEARTPVMASQHAKLAYLDEAGNVLVASPLGNQSETWLEPSTEFAYAQPEWNRANNRLYLVQLKEGQSVDTDIVEFDPVHRSLTPVITQRSAQFEPYLADPWLYYSNVHCVLGCGKIIQEVWRYHVQSGTAEQITLQNSISREPAVDDSESWLYFSGNAAGHFHIYRQSLQEGDAARAEKITHGAVTDLSPAPVDNRLYFVRRDARGSALMCRNESGQLHTMDTPAGVKDIRDLEIRK
ncbi:TolB family protein [Saccharospirillum salsuginis]|uniref:DUF5050 domain-containing protein n=1 Tax=Saccharospirillum salsuginis TaxID=418750 RepID=A0A918KJU7_9GAMM|nr:hypothetical protein [Saccharospirillum salsuginis]GGX65954.1 hypothetical protein GCM10007392_36960 [Saccharospirillum salsuginis]